MFKNVFFGSVICVMFVEESWSQFRPLSPCPRIFKYESDEHQWFGRITISSKYKAEIKLHIKLSIKARLPTRYVGRLELLGDRADVVQQVLYEQPVSYRVHFPLLHPIPKVTEIIFNGDVVCTGPPEFAGPNEVVTSINLDHVLYLPSDTEKEEHSHTHMLSHSDTHIYSHINDVQTAPAKKTYSEDGELFHLLQEDFFNPENFAQPIPAYTIPNYDHNNHVVPHREHNLINTTSIPLTPQRTDVTENTLGDEINIVNKFDHRLPQEDSPVIESRISVDCGIKAREKENALIIGGEPIVRGDWPWMVAMFVKKQNGLEFICSGTLISDKHVISAAHCLHQKNNRPTNYNEVILKLGAFNLQDWTGEEGRTLAVEAISIHPKFDGNLGLKHDIVVLTLNQRVTFTDYIRPICLWNDNPDLSMVAGKYGTVIGWGRNEFGLIVSGVPSLVRIPIVSTETCKASKPAFHLLTSETTFCAGKKDGTGPCNGDSGGGMYIPDSSGRWTIRGVVSASLKDQTSVNYCDLNEYIVFTDAAKYTDWLSSFLGN